MAFWNRKPKQAPDVAEKILSEVNSAISEMKANVSEQTFRDRLTSAISGTDDGADTLHTVYTDYGYPLYLTFSMYLNMYLRFGIATNVVNQPVKTTWVSQPEVINASEQFMTDFDKLVKDQKLWQRLQGLDLRQRVGRYAGLFMRVRDGKPPNEPLEGTLGGLGALVQMMPMYEGQLRVMTTEGSVMKDNYGQPTMYQFSENAEGNRNEKANSSFSIHPSRLVMASEGADDGSIYGVSSLEAVYNSLMDLRKIIGAGGEGFYKNASQSVIFQLKDSASALANADLLSKFNEQYDDFTRNKMTRGLWTPGLEPKALESHLIDPKEFFLAALNDVAAGAGRPATILLGQQTGRLASNEDSRTWLSSINGRRENFANDLTRSVIDWFILNGILPASDYDLEWPDLLMMSDKEKLELSEGMSKTNRDQFMSGEEVPFTSKEIRVAAGFDIEPEGELEGDEPPETDGDETDVVPTDG